MSRSADVVVIGAGVFGACVAYELARAGTSVTILDAARPGRATSASAGGLWPVGESLGLGCGVIFHAGAADAVGDGPQPLPRVFMEFLLQSNRCFRDLRERLLEESDVSIEFEPGTGLLYLLYDEGQRRHAQAILDWLGADGELAEEWTPAQVRAHDQAVTTDLVGAVHFPGDNQVNPMLLAEAFKAAAVAHGATLVPEALVQGLERDGDRLVAVETSRGRFACGAVVNAAGAWSAQIASLVGLDLPVVPVRGQILCTETLEDGALHANLSTRDCYLLQKAHGEVIIGSTTEHAGFDTAVRPEKLAGLAAGAVRAVPGLAQVTLKRTWSGLRPGTPDEFPILGPTPGIENLHMATGGFRTGIVAAPLSGAIVTAAILGTEAPFDPTPFLLSRFEATPALNDTAH